MNCINFSTFVVGDMTAEQVQSYCIHLGQCSECSTKLHAHLSLAGRDWEQGVWDKIALHKDEPILGSTEERAFWYAAKVRTEDERFNRAVSVEHDDGSVFYVKQAFLVQDPEDPLRLWLITRHFGEIVLGKHDVKAEELPLTAQQHAH